VPWQVEGTDQFEEWFGALAAEEQQRVAFVIELLEERGPLLSRPFADTIRGSRFSNLKELRTQAEGDPLRVLFAFDPRRVAILLVGGDKTGDNRFYERLVPLADALYEEHLEHLRTEHDD